MNNLQKYNALFKEVNLHDRKTREGIENNMKDHYHSHSYSRTRVESERKDIHTAALSFNTIVPYQFSSKVLKLVVPLVVIVDDERKYFLFNYSSVNLWNCPFLFVTN